MSARRPKASKNDEMTREKALAGHVDDADGKSRSRISVGKITWNEDTKYSFEYHYVEQSRNSDPKLFLPPRSPTSLLRSRNQSLPITKQRSPVFLYPYIQCGHDLTPHLLLSLRPLQPGQ